VRNGRPVQLIILAGVIAAGAYAVISSADGWADWVVFAVIIVTFMGFARAAHHRRFPTHKRAVSRTSRQR
jgi:hypothetical protein